MGAKITKINVTSKKISARGGLPLILRYIERIKLYGLISNTLVSLLVTSSKGLQLTDFFKQMIAFFIDGTSMAMTYFDQLKKDEGYAAILETTTTQLASSHQIKRFFRKLIIVNNLIFNKILHELFVWRLKIECPKIIVLGIDTMVLNNDDANKREGCEPTYKNVKGYQPLHISWGSFLIDVLFRKGSAHSNHGNDYIERVTSIVNLIRKRYSLDVPIILCGDSGFADQKAYEAFESDLKIHFITTGKMYQDIKDYLSDISLDTFNKFKKNKTHWSYVEFGNKLKSWEKHRRCIYTKIDTDENGQYIIDFNRPDNLIYTNIGNCTEADNKLKAADGSSYFNAESIISLSHQRGADELIHRSLKELATKEQLPFKGFNMNRAYYFILVITHFILEAYKRDVTLDVVSINSYPNTFRRKLIDFAVQVTKGARNIILNVHKHVYKTLNINILWEKCQSPPIIQYM